MRAATALSVTVAAGLALAVIGLKYQVADLEDDLARTNRAIVKEQRAIHVLVAEWSYLNDPTRIGPLARDVLGMAPLGPDRIRTFADLPARPAAGADAPVQAPVDRRDAPFDPAGKNAGG